MIYSCEILVCFVWQMKAYTALLRDLILCAKTKGEGAESGIRQRDYEGFNRSSPQ